jgi:hypothetical protein
MEAQKSITISQLLQNLQEIYDQHGDVTVYLATATTGTEIPLAEVTVGPIDEEPEPLVLRLRGPSSSGGEQSGQDGLGDDLDDW